MKQSKSNKVSYSDFKTTLRKKLINHFSGRMVAVGKAQLVMIPIKGIWCSYYIKHDMESIGIFYTIFPLCVPVKCFDYGFIGAIQNQIDIRSKYPHFFYAGDYVLPLHSDPIKVIEAVLCEFDLIYPLLEKLSDIDQYFEYVIDNKLVDVNLINSMAYVSCLLNRRDYQWTLNKKIMWYESTYFDQINSNKAGDEGLRMPYENLITVRNLLSDRPKLIKQMTEWALDTITRYKLNKYFDPNCFMKYI